VELSCCASQALSGDEDYGWSDFQPTKAEK